MNNIKDRIRFIRTSKNLTQTKFAEILGVTRDVISSFESGRVIPKQLFLNYTCNKFNINMEWLVNGTGDMYSLKNDVIHSDLKEVICKTIMKIDNPESLINIKNLSDLLLNFEK